MPIIKLSTNKLLFLKPAFVLVLLACIQTAFAQLPSNDSCHKAKILKIGSGGFGIGTYQSDSINIDSATVQVGEFFHNSLVTAGNDKRSIWFKFYLPARRGISLELKQNANKIAIKDCGFTTYFSNSCMPGSSEATAAKLTTLNQFGSSMHPCMDPGWYMVQVSAKTRAAGKIYLEITTTFPYQNSAITNAKYDAQVNAYDFGNDHVGKIRNNSKYVDFELGCYTIRDSSELFKPIGSNYSAYNQSAWFVFQAKNDADNTQIKFSSPWTCFGANDTVAFRLYKGDCRNSSSLQLLDSNFNDFNSSSTCQGGCSDVMKLYKCLFDSGQFYSFQILFHKDIDKTVRLYLDNYNSEFDSGYYQPKKGIAKDLGIIKGQLQKYVGFSCGSYINNYSCSNAMPAGGIKLNTWRYNMNQWVAFTLNEQTRLEVNFSHSQNGNYNFYSTLGFRLFKDTITNNCNDIDTSKIIYKGVGNTLHVIDCLEPGQYVFQLLGSDSVVKYSNWACYGSMHLGGDYGLYLNVNRLPKRNLFSLFSKGEADSINAVNDTIARLPKWQTIYAKADTVACNNTLKPESACDTFLTKAMYRVFKIGDVTGDAIADSGMVGINGLSYGSGYRGNHRLYKGNALTLRDNQTVSSFPDKLTGLKPYTSCFGYYANAQQICIEPGVYTLVSFFDNTSIGIVEKPTFNFYHAQSRFDKHSKAEFIDSFKKFQTYYSKADTFTCLNNRDTIDGISCGKKNSYHVFYLDSIAVASIVLPYYWAGYTFSLFQGDIRKGKSGLKIHQDNSGKWNCLYYNKYTTQCQPLLPGWYTIVVSSNGSDYDSATRQTTSDSYIYTYPKNFYVSLSKPTVILPKYNRPHKAAFVDSLINNNKPLNYDTNYNTKAMPQHLAQFTFPTERFECDLDTPVNHFPKNILCDDKTTDIAYYVFTLKKNSFVRIQNNAGYSAKIKMYDIDIRKDSAKLTTLTPIQNCSYINGFLEFCNLKPGKYTLIYFIKRTQGVTATVSPVMYIDSVATSRFDHAKNTYDFGAIPGDGQWYTGKKGDVHPVNSSLPASHDLFTCKTGAQISDPASSACYAAYNPNVYLKDTNAVMYPYDSQYVRIKGIDYYYPMYGYGPQRNLWYSFTAKGKGNITVTLNAINQKFFYDKTSSFKFNIYESDENGALSLDSLKKLGKLDSTLASGLKLVASDYYGYCYYSDLTETFSLPACGGIIPRRYYVVVEINNYNSIYSSVNNHISLQIKYDSLTIPQTKYDYYSQANNINGFNKQNLLINGNAELAYNNGWTANSGSWHQSSDFTAQEGNYSFLAYNSYTNPDLSQIIDVSHFASYIDAGKAKATFSSYIRSAAHATPDESQVVLEYLNASGGVISSSQSGFKANVGSWLKETISNITPVNTRKLRVKLEAKDKNGDTYHLCYFDDMSLFLEVDSVKNSPPLRSGIVYKGNTDYFSSATLDTADYGKNYGCGAADGTIWYKFKVDSTGYLYYNYINSSLSGSKIITNNQYASYYIRLYKNITPGDSLNGLVYHPPINVSGAYYSQMEYAAYNCVSPGWYYLQINKCNISQCYDYAYPRILLDYHRGDFCRTAMGINIDTLESVSEKTLVNCHTIGNDFGEDGSNMGCLYGPKGYKSSWFLVNYTDTTKVDLEFRLAENTSAKPAEIRYRTYYGNCQSLTPAPCNNNSLTSFTIDCIKKGTYYVQVVTPENATGELQMTAEAKKNVDTTCNPIDIFQPNAAFYYNTSCPENVVEFINTSSRGDSIRYLWDFGYNNKKDTALNPMFAYPPLKQEKNYTVKLVVKNIARGSKDSLEISVTVPFAPFIDISNKDTALCVGDSVILKGTLSHGKGIWSTGDTSKNITVKKTDWYYYRMQEFPKLLLNANAEVYPLSKGWTTASGSWDVTSGYAGASDSSYFFGAVNNYNAGTYEIYQEVSISKDSVLIDAGLAKTSMVSYVKTHTETEPDQNQVILEYYDSKNNLLAIYQSGYITNIGSWLKLTHSRTTPPKTRKLKVRLQAINTVNSTPNYAFFDNIILKMRSACEYVDSVYVQVNPLPEVNLGKDTSFCWHDSVLLKPKVDYTDPYNVNEPMNKATVSGKLISSASYDVTNKNVLLTPTGSNKYGNIEWVDSTVKINKKYEIGFEFWMGNTTTCPGYGLYLYLFSNTSPISKSHNTGGYVLALDEYYDQIQTHWNGSQLSSANAGINLDDKTWKKVKIEYDNQKFTIYLDGVKKATFTDATSRTQTGFRLGLGASNDYCNNEHRVRKFYVTSNNPGFVVVPPPGGRSFQYVWNDAKTDSMRYGKGTKTFTVKVSDQNKCASKPDTIKITSIKTYDSLFTKKEEICSELDTFRLSPLVKGGLFYGHKAVDTMGLIKVDSAKYGSNSVFYTVKDTKGCKYIDTAFFVIDSVPNIKITPPNAVCRNASSFKLTVNNTDGFFYGGTYVDSAGNFNPKLTTQKSNKVYYRTKQVNCVGRDSIIVTVDSLPNAAVTSAGPFCKNAGIQTITAKYNSGGNFSGNFIDSTGRFNPLIANKGNNKIYYTFKDGNNCSNKDSILIIVDTIPNAAITAAGPFCRNAGIKTITAQYNSGGKFSGNFIDTFGKFNPAIANKGNNKIYYTFKDANNCSNKDSSVIKVDTVPDAAINASGPFCQNAGLKTITAKFNTGGTFSGGSFINSSGSFNPTNAAKGNNKIYYSFTDGNNCSNKDSILIKVDTIPNASINAVGPFCKNAGIKIVTPKVNSGGKFSGNFIDSTGKFNPSTANKGNNKIYYTFKDGNNCSNKDSIIIKVDTLPNAAITATGPFCKNAGIKTITAQFNSGGKFSGSFIDSVGKFDPLTANKGNNKIYYTFKDGNNCSNKDSILIRVDTIPNAAITAAGPYCQNGGLKSIIAKFNTSGTFSGGSFINSSGSFNPATAAKGNNKIYYTFTDGNNCSNKDSILIKVDTLPNASITAAGPFCKNAGIKTITPKVNSGGKFTGNFIDSTGKFNPLTANKGNNKIYYTFKDGNNCSNKDSILIRVDTLPNAAINASGPFCINAGIKTITAKVNSGGKFSGNFIDSIGNFNPLIAGKGNNKIYYTFKDGNNCSNKDSILIRVDTIPNSAITAAGPFCKNAGIKTITAQFNSGGKFSGSSIDSIGKFNPSTANKGDNKIYYTFKDGNNCSNKDSILIKVDSLPNASITAVGPFCINGGIKTITPKVNSGGKFSGNFIDSTGKFNPLTANKGNNKIYYTFKDGNNCSNKDSILIKVDTIPNAAITAAGPFCKNAGIQTITAKYNSGGKFIGNFIDSTGKFNPSMADKGNNKIYYSFKDGNSCSNIDSMVIRVDTVPNAAITAAGPFCQNSGIKTITAKYNTGGTFSGGSFINSSGSFNPANAAKGNNKIYYSFTDGNNCSNKDSILIKVDTLPDAAITAAGPFCKNDGIKTITPKYNSGGKFSGNFIDSTGKFNPVIANKGNNKIYYSFKDGNNCSNKDSILIKVDTIPNAAITAAGPFCKNGGIKKLTAAFNPGGKFIGGAYIDLIGNFNPASLNKGNYKVYYIFTDGNKCSNIDSTVVKVDSIPNAQITAAGPFCKNAGIKVLKALYNSGGIFSGGTFIDALGSFNPALAAKGNNKVYYSFTDGNKCTNKDSILIKVDTIPNAAIAPAGPFCKNSGIKTLKPAFNPGGKFSGGTFIDSAGKFDPLKAAKGNNKVYYSFIDANKCQNKDSILIKVDTIPNAAITAAGPFCRNAGIKKLSPAFNSGGKFSGGTFVDTLGNFDPSKAVTGINKVYYSFTDGNKCSNKDSINISLDSIPKFGLNAAGPFCNLDNPFDLSAKNTKLTYVYAGGPFVNTSGKFSPGQAAIGTNKVYALGTDSKGCSSLDSIVITVFTVPDASLNPVAEICEDSSSIQIVPKVSGGTFSGGAFVSGTGTFYPPIAKAGIHKVYYDRSTNGCFAKDSVLVTVRPVPVPNVSVSPLNGCEPLVVALISGNGYKCEWKSNGSVISTSDSFTHVFMQGSYSIDLKLTTQYGCEANVKNTLLVSPKPIAGFTHVPHEIFARITTVDFLNKSLGTINSYEWLVDNISFSTNKDASHLFTDTGRFDIQLIVSNAEGCKDTANAGLHVIDEFRVFIPNSISPNKDGINDVFFPGGIGIAKVQLQIFNRWGEKIHDADKPWDCTYLNEPVQDGSYIYLMFISDEKGLRHFFRGSVMVLR